ncbi:MAG: hypothetical protein GY861_04085 [bacterium]|nr:hypothetical protein [bacterium]
MSRNILLLATIVLSMLLLVSCSNDEKIMNQNDESFQENPPPVFARSDSELLPVEQTYILYPPWDPSSYHDEWQEFGGSYEHDIVEGTECNFGYAKAGSIYLGKAYQDVRLFHSTYYSAPSTGNYTFKFKTTYDGSFNGFYLILPPSVAMTYDKIEFKFKVEWDNNTEINTVKIHEDNISSETHLTFIDTETYTIDDIYIQAGTNVSLSMDVYLYVYAEAAGFSRADGMINFESCLDRITIETPGSPPQLIFTPDSYNFGEVDTGSVKSKTFVLENIGGGTVSGNVLLNGHTDYSITSGGGTFGPLGHNDYHNVTVKFEPSSAGSKSTTLSAEGGGCSAQAAIGGTGKNSLNALKAESIEIRRRQQRIQGP